MQLGDRHEIGRKVGEMMRNPVFGERVEEVLGELPYAMYVSDRNGVHGVRVPATVAAATVVDVMEEATDRVMPPDDDRPGVQVARGSTQRLLQERMGLFAPLFAGDEDSGRMLREEVVQLPGYRPEPPAGHSGSGDRPLIPDL